MRDLNTDRPDTTESPITVDAGHYQLEFSFVEYTYNKQGSNRTDGFSVMPMNLKVGLTNNIDMQLVINPYQNNFQRQGTSSSRSTGFGDMELRTKFNIWGNDGGPTAFGIMPFIRIPSGSRGLSNNHIEGGLILPFSINELPMGFDLTVMAEFDFVRNQNNNGYGTAFIHSATLGHDLFSKKIHGYIEYVGIAPYQLTSTYQALLDTGVTYSLTKNIQLDMGINLGLSGGADDFTVFIGMTYRH